MAKKKKFQSKKHVDFTKPSTKTGSGVNGSQSELQPISKTSPTSVVSSGVISVVDSSIKKDVIRSLGLAFSLGAIEILLWILFNHTGLGAVIYNLVRI